MRDIENVRSGIIYAAQNTFNGKVYIGQTIMSLAGRRSDHRRKAQLHRSRSSFHAAIRKYGFETFSWTVIDQAETRDELDAKEELWVVRLRCLDRRYGYNLKTGGNQPRFTEETRLKIGLAGKGRKPTQKQREAIRIRTTGSSNPFYGKSHTEEAKQKNSEAHIGKKLSLDHIAKCIHRGESNWRSKTTESEVRLIKKALRAGYRNCDIQAAYGITKDMLRGIKIGASWAHVEI